MKPVAALPLDHWLQVLWDARGSDLLLVGGSPPCIRVDGDLRPLGGSNDLSGDDIDAAVQSLLTPEQLVAFKSHQDVDFSFTWQSHARIRASAFTQRGETALALRMIPVDIPSFDALGLPSTMDNLVNLARGLILITGPTGSGKSTTLASMVDRINESRAAHIMTIEDPVEFLHQRKRSIVTQREVGVDSPSFQRALRSALREDPDVLLLGEMRDLESIQIALTMAETGHLVLATLHTNDASQAIDRIVDVFPSWRREQIRDQFSASLTAICAQRLVKRTEGGRIAAFEVLIANGGVRNIIRDGKTNQLYNAMTIYGDEGMQTLEMHLAELVDIGAITHETALSTSVRPDQLNRLIERNKQQRQRPDARARGSKLRATYTVPDSDEPAIAG